MAANSTFKAIYWCTYSVVLEIDYFGFDQSNKGARQLVIGSLQRRQLPYDTFGPIAWYLSHSPYWNRVSHLHHHAPLNGVKQDFMAPKISPIHGRRLDKDLYKKVIAYSRSRLADLAAEYHDK